MGSFGISLKEINMIAREYTKYVIQIFLTQKNHWYDLISQTEYDSFETASVVLKDLVSFNNCKYRIIKRHYTVKDLEIE